MNDTRINVTDYLKSAYLIGLLSVVGISAAVTAVLVAWQPMAYVAAKFF